MIEGELSAVREPRNVQVDIEEAAAGFTIRLRDEGGVFLEVLPDEPSDGGKSGEASDAEEGEESEDGGAHREEPRSREMLERRRLHSGAIEECDRDAGSRELELERKVAELTQEKTQLMGENVDLAQERTQLLGENTELADKNMELSEQTATLTEDVTKLRRSLGEEKTKNRVEWRRNCQLLIEYDDLLTAKDREIAE